MVRRSAWESSPELPRHGYSDLYGNACQRLTLPAGASTVRFDAVVTVPDATEEVDPDAAETPVDRAARRHAGLHDAQPVRAVRRARRRGLAAVRVDAAGLPAGAGDLRPRQLPPHVRLRQQHPAHHRRGRVRGGRRGVPRLRPPGPVVLPGAEHPGPVRLRLPARIEVPALPEPMDFAAWIEVYLDGTWYTFDPRNNEARKGRVLIGRGRDALDVAMVTTYGGPVLEHMEVWAEEVPSRPPAEPPGDGRWASRCSTSHRRPRRPRSRYATCCTRAFRYEYDRPAHDLRPAAGRGAPGAARAVPPAGLRPGLGVAARRPLHRPARPGRQPGGRGPAGRGAGSRSSSPPPRWWSGPGRPGTRRCRWPRWPTPGTGGRPG